MTRFLLAAAATFSLVAGAAMADSINLPAGPYKLDAAGKCHAANGKFVTASKCKPAAAPKHCRDPKTGKFVKCGAAGAVPA
jgi:hypothetical protein